MNVIVGRFGAQAYLNRTADYPTRPAEVEAASQQPSPQVIGAMHDYIFNPVNFEALKKGQMNVPGKGTVYFPRAEVESFEKLKAESEANSTVWCFLISDDGLYIKSAETAAYLTQSTEAALPPEKIVQGTDALELFRSAYIPVEIHQPVQSLRDGG